MSKPIIIALLIVSLVGGGAVFAEYSPSVMSLGLNSETEENETEDEDEERSATADAVHDALSGGEASPEDEGSFGEIVSERARDEDVDLGMEVSQAARGSKENDEDVENDNNDENDNDNERSDVAKAVHEALSGDPEITPGSENFGEEVSKRARDKEINLGKEVSEAARKANGSFNAGGVGNSGNSGGSGSPGNSGNRGNSGNAGGGRPGN